MMQAIEEFCQFDIDISTAEEDIYQREEKDRNSKTLKIKQRRTAEYTVHCKYCGFLISHGNFMRQVREKFYIVLDKKSTGTS